MINKLFNFFSYYFLVSFILILRLQIYHFLQFYSKKSRKKSQKLQERVIFRRYRVFATPIPYAVAHPRLRPQEALSEVTGISFL